MVPCWLGRVYSPSAHNEAQRLQVAMIGSPEGGSHAILVRGIQFLPGGLLEELQVAIPGGPVILVIHGARVKRVVQGAPRNVPPTGRAARLGLKHGFEGRGWAGTCSTSPCWRRWRMRGARATTTEDYRLLGHLSRAPGEGGGKSLTAQEPPRSFPWVLNALLFSTQG